MGENSGIEWTDNTFNAWIGCTKVSPGCENCYAEGVAGRFGMAEWGPGKPRKLTSDNYWDEPHKWNRRAEKEGTRYRVFCASLADVFDNEAPQVWRERLWDLIEATPNLDWLLLTKRIGNASRMLPGGSWREGQPNVWLGISVVNQEEADRDIPKLLATPARVRFLSMEPLLGPVTIFDTSEGVLRGPAVVIDGGMNPGTSDFPAEGYDSSDSGIDWVIVGGESGHHARPLHPAWVRSLRDQCKDAGVPFFFKQWGEYYYHPTGFPCFQTWVNKAQSWIGGMPSPAVCLDMKGRACRIGKDFQRAKDEKTFPVAIAQRQGKKKTGRMLDGREWSEFPEEQPSLRSAND